MILIISELVTNAVVHTGCPAVLRMALPGGQGTVPGVVRVEVADASTRPPRPRHADDESTSGRGLELVDGLADRWGWEPSGAGKRIWCELDRCASASAAQAATRQGPAFQGPAPQGPFPATPRPAQGAPSRKGRMAPGRPAAYGDRAYEAV